MHSLRFGALLVAVLSVARHGAAAPPPSPPPSSRGVIALGGPSFNGYYPAMDIPPQAKSNVWAVSGGGSHSMAIYGPERRVIEWPRIDDSGWPGSPPLPNNTYRDQPPNLTNVTAIAAGQSHSLALRKNGRVVMWNQRLTGDNRTDYLPNFITRANIKAISAAKGGGTFSMFLLSNGSVLEWPPRNYSEIYSGNFTTWIVPRPHALLMSGNVKAIAAGYEHCLALLKNGTVVAWGGKRGMTEAGISAQFKSVQVPAAAQANVTAIAAGMAHSLALLKNGTVVAWGRLLGGFSGATCAAIGCGGAPPPPGGPNGVPYAALSGVKAISAGKTTAVALLTGGRVFVWGQTSAGLVVTNIPPEAQSGVVGIGSGSIWWMAIK
ncbi:hypothetical protein HYH03_015373 [Edaphochlamys debaryana]|uniref:Uncharacterized protein n=1 Tax=Edaphochlamys debaryana TaxID=47281 RepID=A0A835XU23_9CHLO|nr:hypothetical protein HYH03_015373 [Edaphochlamys debaryana]|eukprot:KAG2485929.1 hypothetical protein HYH03_015373 [Edaphochlamys debaryana]